MKISVKEFIENFKAKNITNSKLAPTAVEDALREMLEVQDYLPLQTKTSIAKAIIEQSITEVNGYKIIDSSVQFLSFIMSMLVAHTNLEIEDPYEDYDLLCANGLLEVIISLFQKDYAECETLLKSLVADELQTNTTPAIIATFLDRISQNLEEVNQIFKDKVDDLDVVQALTNENVNIENLALLKELLNK